VMLHKLKKLAHPGCRAKRIEEPGVRPSLGWVVDRRKVAFPLADGFAHGSASASSPKSRRNSGCAR
jgi:hypothetical protein